MRVDEGAMRVGARPMYENVYDCNNTNNLCVGPNTSESTEDEFKL